jgi:hypothetical protein
MPITLPINSKFDDKGIREAKTGLDKLGKVAGNFAAAGAAAFAGVAVGVGAFVVASAKQLMEIEKLNAQTSAAILSTGSAAGKTLDDINKMNSSLEKLTGIEAEVIQEGQNMLLTFTNINGDTFDEATEAALDLSVALGKDMQSSALLVGKALNDPIAGLGALSKAGVQFTDDQRAMITEMVEFGDTAGAQSVILEELNKQFGGSAEAFGETTAGKLAKLENVFGELGETIAGPVVESLDGVIEKIQEFLDENGEQLKVAMEKVGDALVYVVEGLVDFFEWYTENPDIFNNIALGFAAITTAATLFSIALSANPVGVIMFAIIALGTAITALAINWDAVTAKMGRDWTDFGFGVVEGAQTIANAVIDFINVLVGPINGLIDILNGLFGLDLNRLALEKVNWYNDLAVQELRDQGIRYGYTGGSVPTGRSGMPQFAEGGIVTGPMVGLVGEAGPEAIIPLDRLGKMGGATYNINVTAGVGDPQVIGQQIVTYIKRYEKASGPVFVGA